MEIQSLVELSDLDPVPPCPLLFFDPVPSHHSPSVFSIKILMTTTPQCHCSSTVTHIKQPSQNTQTNKLLSQTSHILKNKTQWRAKYGNAEPAKMDCKYEKIRACDFPHLLPGKVQLLSAMHILYHLPCIPSV